MTKNADIGKSKEILVLKGIFYETKYVCVFTYKILILTSFRQGVILPPAPPQNELLKNKPRLGLTGFSILFLYMFLYITFNG